MREEETFVATLGYFDGKTQRRSIGISLVEGYWLPKKKRMDVLVPILVNQTIHLLLNSEASESATEERNLIRLFFLLKKCIPLTSQPGEHAAEVLNAILRKDPCDRSKGVPLARGTLKHWSMEFGGDDEYYDAEQPAQEGRD